MKPLHDFPTMEILKTLLRFLTVYKENAKGLSHYFLQHFSDIEKRIETIVL
jgi:hypothetical protein